MDEWSLSEVALAASVSVVVAGVIATRRRPRAGMGNVRLLPWNSIMLTGMIVAVFAAVHLITLWRGA